MYGCVDIGGTKTLIAVFNAAGKIVEQIKFPTPVAYDSFLLELASTVDNLSTKDYRAVGAAAPGRIDHERGLLIEAGNLGWKDEQLQADLEKLFHAPVVIENDAKTATVSEARAVLNAYEKVVYITVSTGINIGFCVNGVLDRGMDEDRKSVV